MRLIQTRKPIQDVNAHQDRQIISNDAAFSRKQHSIPSWKLHMSFYGCMTSAIVIMEMMAVHLTYEMALEGQSTFTKLALSLQAIACIGALHILKKLGNQTIDRYMQFMAWVAFACFAIGFGIIAATTSLKEVLLNILPDLAGGGTSIDGSALDDGSSKAFDMNSLNWLIPPAWYMAFSGLTLVLAFAAAEAFNKILELHSKITRTRGLCDAWTNHRDELKQTEREISRLEASEAQATTNLRLAIQQGVNAIVSAYEDGLSYGPRKLIQTIHAQSLQSSHHEEIMVTGPDGHNIPINLPKFEQDLKLSESSVEQTQIQNLIDTACQNPDAPAKDQGRQLSFNFKDKE